jgi:multiple sugar transport system permease protein
MTDRKRRLGAPALTALGVLLLIGFLFPIYWMVATSVKAQPDVFVYPPKIIPTHFDLTAWKDRIAGDATVLRYVLNSTVIALGTMALSLLLAAPAAYAVAHLPMRGKSAFMLGNLSALMFPAIMLATPLFVIFSRLQLTNNYLGLILANTTAALPFVIVLLRPFFAGIARELSEAAQIDGCTAFGAFRRVILPVAKPGLVSAGIFAFLIGWGDLVFAITLTNTDTMRPVTAGLWAFVGANNTDWPAAMAFSTLAMLPPLCVFLFAQRHVVAGLTAGSLKG